jgi:hypothetical protein
VVLPVNYAFCDLRHTRQHQRRSKYAVKRRDQRRWCDGDRWG